MLEMPRVREVFEASTGLHGRARRGVRDSGPRTLSLDHRFEELRGAAQDDPVLAESVAGELIVPRSRSARVAARPSPTRWRSSARRARACSAWRRATTPGSGPPAPIRGARGRSSEIIDTEHYQRVEDLLQYVAWRNNTFSLHVHVGVHGAERAVRVCDRLRAVMPELLAISANSPFLDGRHSGLHSARTQIFTKSLPRCGIPDPFGRWQAYADYIDFLARTRSITEFTQVWWSVRPHHTYGTV